MIRKLLLGFVVLVIAAILLPPLWYAVFPYPDPPELPAAGRRVELASGLGMNIVEQGTGPTIVLVHGLPGSAYDWRMLSPALAARGHRVVAIDRIGYGHSDPREPGSPHTPTANAGDLNELLEALWLENVTVVGWSYGGPTAITAAMLDRSRIARLVLVGTGGPDSAESAAGPPPELPGFMRFLYSDAVLAWRARVPPIGLGLISALSAQAFSEQPMPDWWIPGVVANFSREATLLSYRAEMFELGDDEGEWAPAQGMPTLLVHGDDDRLAPVAISEYLHETMPGSKLRIVEGGSHMLPVTHTDYLADEISAFVGGG